MPKATQPSTAGDVNSTEALFRKAARSFRAFNLPSRVGHLRTAAAQKQLDAASVTVHNMLFTMCLQRAMMRELQKKDHRGRLSDADQDVLRAVVAFAGAGLDAALKQLIRDAIRSLISTNANSYEQFTGFVDIHLANGESINRKRLREILLDARGAPSALLEAYERELTGDSLQSAAQVARVCQVLGVDEPEIRKRLRNGGLLDQMFRARNTIIHELDLKPDELTGRTPRTRQSVDGFAREALSVTQAIINDVAKQLTIADGPSS